MSRVSADRSKCWRQTLNPTHSLTHRVRERVAGNSRALAPPSFLEDQRRQPERRRVQYGAVHVCTSRTGMVVGPAVRTGCSSNSAGLFTSRACHIVAEQLCHAVALIRHDRDRRTEATPTFYSCRSAASAVPFGVGNSVGRPADDLTQ